MLKAECDEEEWCTYREQILNSNSCLGIKFSFLEFEELYDRSLKTIVESWRTTGLQNEAKLRKDFWDTINNPKKVNINLLSDEDVETYAVGKNKDVVMVIYVPRAKREQKPVYINNDIFNVWEDESL